MQKTRAKTIKGLSVANICLCAIWLVLLVVLGVILTAGIEYYDPIADALRGSSGSVFDYYGSHHGYGYSFDNPYYGYDAEAIMDDVLDSQVLVAVMGLGMAFVVIAFIMQAVCLIASILMLVNCDKPQKLGMVFGWGIAGAILSFITTGVISTVLFVLATIFAYQDRQLYKKGYYPIPPVTAQAQPGQPMQPVPPVHPGVPTAMPGQPAQPVQPVQAPQTVQPAQQIPSQQQIQPAVDPQSQQTMQVADEIMEPAEVVETSVVEAEIQPTSGDEQQGNPGENQ